MRQCVANNDFMDPKPLHDNSAIFPRTRWTLMGRLREPEAAPLAARALEEICNAYLYPLYVYARRFGLNETDAKDAVQDLFAQRLDGSRMAAADVRASSRHFSRGRR